jgi:hypothetical protein
VLACGDRHGAQAVHQADGEEVDDRVHEEAVVLEELNGVAVANQLARLLRAPAPGHRVGGEAGRLGARDHPMGGGGHARHAAP